MHSAFLCPNKRIQVKCFVYIVCIEQKSNTNSFLRTIGNAVINEHDHLRFNMVQNT